MSTVQEFMHRIQKIDPAVCQSLIERMKKNMSEISSNLIVYIPLENAWWCENCHCVNSQSLKCMRCAEEKNMISLKQAMDGITASVLSEETASVTCPACLKLTDIHDYNCDYWSGYVHGERDRKE